MMKEFGRQSLLVYWMLPISGDCRVICKDDKLTLILRIVG